MALYSWFSRTDKKSNIKSVSVHNDLAEASESAKYNKNYTMWPTATIKQDAKAILPIYNKVDKKIPKDQQAILPTKATLAVYKN